mgnify:CR=1 FL=1
MMMALHCSMISTSWAVVVSAYELPMVMWKGQTVCAVSILVAVCRCSIPPITIKLPWCIGHVHWLAYE